MWGHRELWMAQGVIWTVCSPSQTLQSLAPVQSSGRVCVRTRVYMHVWAGQLGRAAEGIPGIPAALAHTSWAPLLMSFSRPSGALWRLNQGRLVSKWRNGGSDWLMGQSEPWGPYSEGGKGALISGDAEPVTGERSAREQVSGGAMCPVQGGAHAGWWDCAAGGGGH